MAGTALNYSTAAIARGPVNIWLNVAAPAAGAEVVIDSATLTPDATANPNARHLGMTTGGAALLHKPSTQMREADELSTAYGAILSGEEMTISPKGALQVGQDFDLMATLMLGATLTAPTGKKKITGGGLSTLSLFTVLAIWAQPEAPTKYEYWLLYSAFNDAGLAFTLSRKTDASSDLSFRGFAVAGRPLGDNLYQIVKTI